MASPSAPFGPERSPRGLAWLRAHRGGVGIALAVVAGGVYPSAVGTFAARSFAARASTRLGRAVTVGQGRAGLGDVTFTNVRVAGTTGPDLVFVGGVVVPFGVAFGGSGPVRVSGLRANIVRGGADDNVTAILDRLRGHGGGTGKSAASPPGLVIESASIEARDRQSGLVVTIDGLSGEVLPNARLALHARGVHGLLALAGDDQGPRFGADELHVEAPLEGTRPRGLPAVRVKGGFATPLPRLSLTGIAGVIAPPPREASGPAPNAHRVTIDLHGSYGGAREDLWTAKGHADFDREEGALALRAEQFSLDKIADVLPKAVLAPANTKLDAAFDLAWSAGVVHFGGDLAAVGVSVQNDALASDPVEDVSIGLALRGTIVPAARRIELERVEARVRDLTARLTGTIELPSGSYRFGNGRKIPFVPKVDLTFAVPRLPCAKLLASIPAALTPKLEGFVLKGMFEAQVAAKVDFAALDALDLHGKVGIDGCKVVKAPNAVTALQRGEPIVVNVEVPPPPGAGSARGETETLAVVVGPENPDFTPYDQISPYLINSIMTTEDNGFFKHRGWVTSEFKSALRRNLAGGGFRLGASSITMQMVKNVLLSQEKTLSRKLQELFLVWYLEQNLPKERILELYFNAIEFGPRLYGIGRATRHYFGKKPSELNPVEAAFFSSILPSPKRRYIQYCHGVLYPPWDKYVHRIVAKAHERGRLTDEELAQWSVTPLVFDRSEATFSEKQCLEWVKSMATHPEAEVPPDLADDADAAGDEAFSARKKLGRLFVRGGRQRGPAAPGRSVARAR
ncbi:MAG TPA: biosynthetic peptidoglycan transglycosylase [Polyangia bacterium]|nr:biosynthetic peptidoglycan transglycosylase [Polyangia bacterium]